MMDAVKISQNFDSNIADVQRAMMDNERVLITITKTGAQVKVTHRLPGEEVEEALTYQIGVVE